MVFLIKVIIIIDDMYYSDNIDNIDKIYYFII